MSYVHKLWLTVLALTFTLGCSKQDPVISLIGFSSLSPKLSGQGPYEVNDSHFSTPYEISGQCSSDIKNLQVKLEGQDWNTLTTLLSNSDGDCSDENFKISFKLEELGFALNDYKTKSIWLRAVSLTGESQPQQIDVIYNNTSPPPTTPQATVPTISSINYISNTEIDIKWALPDDHGNDEVVISIKNGNVTPDCSSGFEVPAQSNATTNISSGNGTTSFDLNSNDITISICGKNSGNQSSPASMVYYKKPLSLTAMASSPNNTSILVSGISADGATNFEVLHALTTDPLPICSGTGSLTGPDYTIPGLPSDTGYNIVVCAYNNNSPAQWNRYVINDVFTMKDQPTPPAGLTLNRISGSDTLTLSGLNPAITYYVDYSDNSANLKNDFNNAALTNINSQNQIQFSTAKNKKYYVRVWSYDSQAFPNSSTPVDYDQWSYIQLLKRDENSKKWGYYISNTMANPHDLTNFTNECTDTIINSINSPNECVNAGLLWHIEIPGATSCNDYKVEIEKSSDNNVVPFLWKCVQRANFADFQIVGVKNNFKLNSLINLSSFVGFNVLLKDKNYGTVKSNSLNAQTLWTNPVNVLNSTSQTTLGSEKDQNIIIIGGSHTGPLILDGISNASIIQNRFNFDTSSRGSNITVNNSRNLFLEVNVSNSNSTYTPLNISNSKNITLSNSNIHSSSKGLLISNSNYINISNTKIMNIQSSGALLASDTKNLYITNSKFSNSYGGVSFDTTNINIAPKISISQSIIVGIRELSSPIRVTNSNINLASTNVNHVSFSNNSLESIYLNSTLQNLTVNQIYSTGSDLTVDGIPDNDAVFVSYEDSNSHFSFSQLGFSNHLNNIYLKHNVTSGSEVRPNPEFYNSYLDSDTNPVCNLQNSGGDYDTCDSYPRKTNTFTFGDFYSPSTTTTVTTSDWINTSIYDYWLYSTSSCSTSQTCTLYSITLNRSNSNILDSSYSFSGVAHSNNNYAPSTGKFNNPDCSSALNKEAIYKNSVGVSEYYLSNAAEINTDFIGNNNGLCESNETCILSPNLGAYQGHMGTDNDYKKCNFSSSTNVINVEVYAHPYNGKL
ncbi:MAG: right-handed parallel beta-helix repeat-containing protein [Bdellovibrionales bacterium]|nr:right-handed parallel beta-helix repeat-containing protein [Bdellovibrionales bacterium]